MLAVIRIDNDGNPYLVCTYKNAEGEERNAQEDAERLFFNKLNANGGLLHLVPGSDKGLKLIITTGTVKRKANVAEGSILKNTLEREEPSMYFTPKDHPFVDSPEPKAEDLSPKYKTDEEFLKDVEKGLGPDDFGGSDY